MPQKKNPDVAELVRGKSARAIGNLVSIATLLKGLPLAYNRDLQEDKIFVFDSAKTVRDSLSIMKAFVKSLKFNRKRMLETVSEDPAILATDLADILVKQGVPFRKTHEIVGHAVAHVLDKGIRLQDLSDKDLLKFSDRFPKGTSKLLSAKQSVLGKIAFGGPSPQSVRTQAIELKKAARKYI